jgi:hypothetical protein
MTSAGRLYRLVAAMAAAGITAVVVGAVVAGAKTTLALPSPAALADACRQLVPPPATFAALPVVALAALGLVVLARAGASAWQHARAERLFRTALRSLGRLDFGETPVTFVDDPAPRAFCAGYLRPRVYLSGGALTRLSPDELQAVVAHERHHLRRRDPLRLLIAGILADGLFFLPALRRLADRYGALAELAADEAAARTSSASTLASALLAFNDSPHPELVVGIAPERVDHLLGERPRWELPLSLVVGSVVTLAGIAAAIVAVASLSGAHIDLGLLIAQSCMALMCAVGLAVAGAGALLARRNSG